MDFERLEKLKRQRELIQEHLDWLNAEIDRATIHSTPTTSPKASRLAEAFATNKPVDISLGLPDPESAPGAVVAADLYSELGPDTKGAAAETRRGCLILSAIAFGSLAAAIAAIYIYY